MTGYLINKVCYMVEQDEAFRERVRNNPSAALAELNLPPETQTALESGDVAALCRQGGHPFLLQHLWRHKLFGLTRDLHFERIQQVLKD